MEKEALGMARFHGRRNARQQAKRTCLRDDSVLQLRCFGFANATSRCCKNNDSSLRHGNIAMPLATANKTHSPFEGGKGDV
jgi:hypothetical protein